MSALPASATQPASVDVSLTEGIDIVWQDGHHSHYVIADLRAACPCAGCQDSHGTGLKPTAVPPPAASPLPLYKPRGYTLQAVKPVGRYALNFTFSDAHAAGIFTWEYLRQLCTCTDCVRQRATSGG